MDDRDLLHKASDLLIRQGHTTLGALVNDIAQCGGSIPSPLHTGLSETDEDEKMPLRVLRLKRHHGPSRDHKTSTMQALEGHFQEAIQLVVALTGLRIRIKASNKTIREIDTMWTIRLRETWKYFVPPHGNGVDSVNQDLVWSFISSHGAMQLDQWGEYQVIEAYEVVQYATALGELTPVELLLLARHGAESSQTFCACLAILLGRNHLPQLELTPWGVDPRDCVSATFLSQTKQRLASLLNTRKFALKRHVLRPDDADDPKSVLLVTTW
jgi:hypothetical protein